LNAGYASQILSTKPDQPHLGVNLIITFANASIEEICNSDKVAKKKHGKDSAKKLRRRLDDIAAADTLAVMGTVGRCHQLEGHRAGQLALDLAGLMAGSIGRK